MPRAKPSDWRPPKELEWRVEHLYPEAVWEIIFLHLRPKNIPEGSYQHSISDEKEKTYAKSEILRIARALSYYLRQRARPTSGNQRAAIQSVLKGTVMTRTALNKLDSLSFEAIRSEVESLKKEFEKSKKKVEKSKKKVEKFPAWDDPESGLSVGDIVKHWALVATHQERIFKRVLKKLPGTKSGRIRRDPEHEAVRQLSGLWSRYHGDSNDDGAFWEFVEIVLEPLKPYGAAVPKLSTIGRYRSYPVAQQVGPKKVADDDVRAILEAQNECLPDDVRTKLAPKEPIPDDVRARRDAENERRRQSLEYPARYNPRARELLARFPTGKPARGKQR